MRFPRLIFAFAAQSAAEFRASRGTHLDHTTEEVFWAGLAFLPEADHSRAPAVSLVFKPALLSPSACGQVTRSQDQITNLTSKQARPLQSDDISGTLSDQTSDQLQMGDIS
jgi:hypothetical protein